ncbi:unnamed protein product, partial [Trichobilharzia regenti]
MMLPSLLLLIILSQCNTENNAAYSPTASTDTFKTPSSPELDPVNKANNYASAITKDDSKNAVNVSYVILPNQLYLGQINLITVRSRQPRTRLSISM